MLEIYDLEVVDIQDVSNLLKRDEYIHIDDSSDDSSVLDITVLELEQLTARSLFINSIGQRVVLF